MQCGVGGVNLIDDDLGFRESRRDISALVLFGFASDIPFWTKFGRVIAEGGFEIGDEVQLLILNRDQAKRVVGDLFRDSGDSGDLVTEKAHGRVKEKTIFIPFDVRLAR